MLLKNLWRQYYSFNNHENNFCSNNLAAKFALQTPESCRFSLDSLSLVLATACKADFPTVLSFFSAMTLKFSKKKKKSHISYTNSNKIIARTLTHTHTYETGKAPLPPKTTFLSNSHLSCNELGTNVLYIEMQQL